MPQNKGNVIQAKGKKAAPTPVAPASKAAAKQQKSMAFATTKAGKKAAASMVPKQNIQTLEAMAPVSDEEDEDEEFEEFDEEDFSDEEGSVYDDGFDSEDDEEFDEGDYEELDEFAGEEGIEFSDEDGEEDDEEEDDDDDDDADFEAKAAKFKKQMQEQTRAAMAEQAQQQSNAARATVLADVEREVGADDSEEPKDIMETLGLMQQTASAEELRDRIKETVRVLSRFKEEREEGRGRDEYMQLLKHDLMELFEYNEFLMDVILDMFPPHEAVEFLEAMEKPRPTTIRVNTIKCKRRDLVQNLVKRGMNVEALEKWSKVGLQVFESNVPIAGTVEYLAGHYMLQSAVSFLPVMALMPEENERVLDMSAAPGGKTTYIAQLMKNTGVLFANDVSEPRCKSLNANLQRLGVTNCLVTNYDGSNYNKVMKNFNRVLLDAPCTGCGIISRDKSIKTSKSYEDVQRASQLQRRLLLSAIDCCKTGGFVVYSTCSFLVEEDEAVVDYALRRRNVRLVDMGLPFGRPGVTKFRHSRYDPTVAMSRKYFPHVHNMDGFFVAKFEKLGEQVLDIAADRDEATVNEYAAKRDAAADAKAKKAAAVAEKKAKKAAPTAPVQKVDTKVSVPPNTNTVPRGTKAAAQSTPEAGQKRKGGDASDLPAKKGKKEAPKKKVAAKVAKK